MPANWLPIEDWLANALQEREEVREAVVSTDGKRVALWMKDGRQFRITVRDPLQGVPVAIRGLGYIEEVEQEDGE